MDKCRSTICLNKILLLITVVICGLPLAVFAQKPTEKKVVFKGLSDHEIVEKLTSANEQTANSAVAEVMDRGERMIPWLLSLKGDQRCFQGATKLGDWGGGTLRVFGGDKKCILREYVITNELTALFLISAIYKEDVEFSSPPILCDYWAEDNEGRCGDHGNTQERITKAWASTEKWLILLREKGMTKLRAEGRDPLEGSGVRF